MTNDEATIAMVDANVQREEVLPSEKAFAFKMKFDAIRHQGKSINSTLFHDETKMNSGDMVGQSEGLTRIQVFRYIRLTYLIPKVLSMVDEKRLTLSAAVEISYFNSTVQQWIYDYICENGVIKQEHLVELRKYREDENLTKDQLIDFLHGHTASVPVLKKITLNEKKLQKFFPANYSKADIENVIFELLEQWKKGQKGS